MKKYIVTMLTAIITLVAYGQQVEVSGFVQDAENRTGIANVSIQSTKLKRGVGATDKRGYFKVSVSADDQLLFNSIGYNPVTENLAGKKVLIFNVYLSKKQNAIEEVVVQGYMARKQETMTGSSVRIDGSQLQDNPVSNVMQMLQGKVAGMNVQLNTGQPGARTSVMIRGLSNISQSGAGMDGFLTPTSPLYIVDGIQVDDNTDFAYGFNTGGVGISPISMIPPEDIENVDILKDAAATALYGSRGAYGVIIITTKRGQSKVPIIQYTTNQFLSVPPRLRATIGGMDERYARINQIMTYNNGDVWGARDLVYNNPILSDSLNPYYNNATNWQDVFYQPRYNQTHNINASGGDVTYNYKINGAYYNERGIIQNTGFSRYTLNMNAEYRPTQRFRVMSTMSGNFGSQKTGSGNSVTQGGVASASSASSLLPSPSASFVSPDIISSLAGRNDNRTNDLRTTLDMDFEVLKGLRASNQFSFNYISTRTDNFTPGIANNNNPVSYNYDSQRNVLYNLTRLNYLKEFGTHLFSTYVFSELKSTDFQAKAQQKFGYPNDQLEGPFGFNAGSALGGILNNMAELREAGFAGTASINLFSSRYIFDATYRWDRSSVVGSDIPWRRNPSLALRWNLDKEPWLTERFDWLDFLSLRGSWGKTIVPTGTIFDANGRYTYAGYFNNNQTIGFDWERMPNTRLIPSTTTQLSGAMEFGLFGNRVTTTQELYYRQVDNMLWEKPLADHNGFSKLNTNEVSMVNYGYEFNLMVRPLGQDSELYWDISLNGAWNEDVLTMLPDNNREFLLRDPQYGFHTLYRLGRNSMSHVLFNYRGTFATDADVPINPANGEALKLVSDGQTYYFKAGDPFWTDVNGDYIIDDRDAVVVGNSQPKLIGGFSTSLRYKGFTLNTQLSYTYRRDIINAALANQMSSYSSPLFGEDAGRKNAALLPLDQYLFWGQNGDVADFPNPFDYQRFGAIRPYRANQTLFMEDGSYLKINYITVGYNFPREKTQRYGITSMRVYLTANNVATFSRYSGPNPELVTSTGYDRTDGYPTARSYTCGVSVQF
ncbi:SusC/RagA family TonB-linked outer membrane protein [Sphingobacterium deserti]|uniref:TonB-dependent receptor plug n=1 Tax=Sphingobacterium deserti TaxID=1229276 RepID=A0A0B8T5C0_9SPHI|nr:SusC/RagA family TonB-linked outer membrane protein [Sphingobacterium deserti]KGE15673.1 TonB-dependent receptor plug [Sphingobacterium deserti]